MGLGKIIHRMDEKILSLQRVHELYKQTKELKPVRDNCGTKALNLCIAKETGLEIPPGFVITGAGFEAISKTVNNSLPSQLWDQIVSQIREIEDSTKTKFSGENPLFLAVSGVTPTPGVVCVGMNDYTTRMLEKKSNNRAFAYYCYSKFIRSFGVLVFNTPEYEFDDLLDSYIASRDIQNISKCCATDWIQISKLFKSVIVRYSGSPFPQDPMEQLKQVIMGSVNYFGNENATNYRAEVQEDSTVGHSILVTMMRFGGINSKSCAGAISSHDLVTGAAKISGIFGLNALVDDVCEENLDTSQIDEMSSSFGDCYKALSNSFNAITKIFKEPMTLKFVVEDGHIYIVSIKRSTFSGFGRFSAAVSLVDSKVITSNDALTSLHPSDLKSILAQRVKKAPHSCFCKGHPGAYGGNTGIISVNSSDALMKSKRGQKVVFVRKRFCHTDMKTLIVSNGLITVKGGPYSAAAYYANALCKPAVIGCSSLLIDESLITSENQTLSIGDEITISNGVAYVAALPLTLPDSIDDKDVKQVMRWIDETRSGKISVFNEAKSIDEVVLSFTAGADGVGMFKIENFIVNDAEAITAFAETNDQSIAVEIENRLSASFSDLFAAAKDKLVTVQLIANPLASFLPSAEELTEEIATLRVQKELSKDFAKDDLLQSKINILNRVKHHTEKNPLLGLRGVRLGLINQEMIELQIRSILKGAKVSRRRGAAPRIRIMLPLVTDAREIVKLESITNDVILEFEEAAELGAMIDNPRACYVSGRIAEIARILCFDSTNLHEATFGMSSKDDPDMFLSNYTDNRIFDENPFTTIDQNGVGKLMKKCVEDAKKANPDVLICITGQNCYDIKSVNFCYNIGIGTITCDPMMTPVARLCAAQAVLTKA
ncbi:pyruvate, phosphate dikinase family protein [Tritrichomonas foetus]|uniref:Pyruvate, phosphate dikinase n=1 Tax=Tritrichomonas foetus TaxID=1144522 RepID=A0A1J4L6W6_9EUKA|nr:pyruvate, phosphate dikinase family protein [Tritrichomonas foetus]|eukprot:OHT17685.1 pyruvate, phosphate dikinase family protein [Tritrichomonas foetus]